MKNIFKYINLLLVVLLITSCDKFLDVNVDPNNPTEVSPDLILPVAETYTATYIQQRFLANAIGNLFMYNWSQADGFSWYEDEMAYSVNSSFYTGCFNTAYSSALKQYQVLTQLGDEYVNYKAIGEIMKAYHFQLLVDFYGDVPYSEALLRKDNATPVYDDAAEIYADLIVKLSAAIDLIKNADNTAVTPDDDDVIFGGDMNEWIKFANTIKLRILVRKSDVEDISADVAAIVAEGSGFITEDVMVNPGYTKDVDKQNPMWDRYGEDTDGNQTKYYQATCASDYIINYLTSTNDSRIDYIYEKPETGHKGVPQGLTDYDTPIVDQYDPDFVSNMGVGILKGPDMGATIFTLAESNFNQAEAAQKGVLSGSAKAYYEAAIQASFDYLGAGSASTYYNQSINLVGWDASSNKLEAIITQKWIAVNGITAEQSWFDYSRTGYPSNLPVSMGANSADRPVRLYYPAGEYSSNGANVPTQPNAFTAKVFWGN